MKKPRIKIMKIAAIQLNAMFPNVKANSKQSELYIEQAACAGAELVFQTAILLHIKKTFPHSLKTVIIPMETITMF